jgi:hypothetical protein
MDNNLYIGVDPGKNGGIAAIYKEQINFIRCGKDPKEMSYDFQTLVWDLTYEKYDKVYCMVEHVHSFPGQGVVSTFSFGQNYGRWEGIIASLDIHQHDIEPYKWMSWFNIKKGVTRKERKRELKELSEDLSTKGRYDFPEKRITFNVSDAILIAHYCNEIMCD